MHRFDYKWRIADGYPAQGITQHGTRVFGTFICGGGSSMGYKLAGYDHLGGVELDERIARVYERNHHPKYLFNEDIRKFIKRQDFPEELYDLGILDGSPPCTSFSMSGNREDDWGKHKVFTEGQAFQRLDDLFFDYIRLVDILRPKISIAENVTGLVQGNAKAYTRAIIDAYRLAGYAVQIFKLNAGAMGVPQRRERVFFIARRNDLNLPPLRLAFNEPPIVFGKVMQQTDNTAGKELSEAFAKWWRLCKPGKAFSSVHPKGSFFNNYRLGLNYVCPTIAASTFSKFGHPHLPNEISDECVALCGSFPEDYDYLNERTQYLVGMSVPPVMTAQIATQVYEQWLSKIN